MSGHQPFETLRARMTPERRAQNAATTQAVLARLQTGRAGAAAAGGRADDRELALTDDEWQTLGLEEPPEA